ncbi:purine permease 1-like [Aristolochia californica]|uniref:purine permease 1-like n=1 Tax=Aristolochia californica TaxID=171875 RepID=UPI0035D64536
MERERSLEEGSLSPENKNTEMDVAPKRHISLWILLLNVAAAAVGTIGGPLLIRLYYLHGGNRKWVASWIQTAGFPILLIPLSVLFCRSKVAGVPFWAEPKLLISSAVIGLFIGLDNFMYSLGLSYLPVSTSSLLFSTQLAFTAFFALIIVKQKFTPYSINAVVLMTLGAILLGIRKNGDRPPGVTNGEYLLGFVITLGAASLLGFLLPCIETAYTKASRAITYSVVMQFQFGTTFFATVFCTIGMLINNDFSEIAREARAYELGEVKYYVVLACCAVAFQFLFVGMLGVIFCTTSLFSGVLTATLLPMTEVAAVIIYHEKFTGEKGMALALCIWGFTSYFYGAYRGEKKQENKAESK